MNEENRRGGWDEKDNGDSFCPCCSFPNVGESALEEWRKRAEYSLKHKDISEYVDAIINALIEGGWCRLDLIMKEPLLKLLPTQQTLAILNLMVDAGFINKRDFGSDEFKLNEEYHRFLLAIAKVEANEMGGRGV